MSNEIYQIGAPFALAAVLNIVGFALKKSPSPDWLIPIIIMMLGGVAFPFIADYSKITYECKNPQVLMAIFGVGIGGVSVGLHQGMKQFLGRNGNGNGHAVPPAPQGSRTDIGLDQPPKP